MSMDEFVRLIACCTSRADHREFRGQTIQPAAEMAMKASSTLCEFVPVACPAGTVLCHTTRPSQHTTLAKISELKQQQEQLGSRQEWKGFCSGNVFRECQWCGWEARPSGPKPQIESHWQHRGRNKSDTGRHVRPSLRFDTIHSSYGLRRKAAAAHHASPVLWHTACCNMLPKHPRMHDNRAKSFLPQIRVASAHCDAMRAMLIILQAVGIMSHPQKPHMCPQEQAIAFLLLRQQP